jgi:hypothetical protein
MVAWATMVDGDEGTVVVVAARACTDDEHPAQTIATTNQSGLGTIMTFRR